MDFTVIQKIAIWALPLLFAITLHEVAHGWVAYLCGDYTAKLSGRLTINPVKHIDPVGTIVVPLLLLMFTHFVIGWAKPVPVNSRNVTRPRLQMPLISLAGPMANLVMALFWAFIAKAGLLLGVSNPWFGTPMQLMGEAGVWINVVLAVFNCLPLPPLDGWHVLLFLFPGKLSWHLARFERYGFFIVLLLVASGALTYVIWPPISLILNGIMSLFGITLTDIF